EAWLVAAEHIGRALARRSGDATVAESVRRIRAMPGARARRRLGEAFRLYGAARERYRAADYGRARDLFDAADAALPPDAGPLAGWVAFHRGTTMLNAGDYARADSVFAALLARWGAHSYPVLIARTRWAMGLAAVRRGRYEPALREYEAALQGLREAGEEEHAGAVEVLIAEAHDLLASDAEALEWMLRSCGRCAPIALPYGGTGCCSSRPAQPRTRAWSGPRSTSRRRASPRPNALAWRNTRRRRSWRWLGGTCTPATSPARTRTWPVRPRRAGAWSPRRRARGSAPTGSSCSRRAACRTTPRSPRRRSTASSHSSRSAATYCGWRRRLGRARRHCSPSAAPARRSEISGAASRSSKSRAGGSARWIGGPGCSTPRKPASTV